MKNWRIVECKYKGHTWYVIEKRKKFLIWTWWSDSYLYAGIHGSGSRSYAYDYLIAARQKVSELNKADFDKVTKRVIE